MILNINFNRELQKLMIGPSFLQLPFPKIIISHVWDLNQHKFVLFMYNNMLESRYIMTHSRKEVLYWAWVELRTFQWENPVIFDSGGPRIDPLFLGDQSLLLLIFRDRSLDIQGLILVAWCAKNVWTTVFNP